MSVASTILASALTAAAAVFVLGLAARIADYARTPAPLKIPTTPAPTGAGGVSLRLLRELVLFESLFKGSLWTWLFGWLFHASLALVLLRHARYFVQPLPEWLVAVQPSGTAAAFGMVIGLAGLWARRLLVDRIRYISTPSDHAMLALLLAIAASGIAMRFVLPTDVVAVKAFALGLLSARWQPLPDDLALWSHLALVAVLVLIFPFSKLLHAPGLFFSPSRNQVDDPRERRHLAPWASRLERAPAAPER